MDLNLFSTTLDRMVYLFLFIALGYALMKMKLLPDNTNTVLSKLENLLFLPALMLSTFMGSFTTEMLAVSGKLLFLSFCLEMLVIPLAILGARLCFKGDYLRKIATYGLSFSNFGFMGNAVMQALFPEIFLEYSVFTLPLWIIIMLWGVPYLLISDSSDKKLTLKARLKPLLNPMIICMLIGMVLGLTGVAAVLPTSICDVITVTGSCMSPIAMLLTGITVAKTSLPLLLKKPRVYILTGIRLLLFPLLFIGIFAFIPKGSIITETFLICAAASLAMPLGLNTIVVPGAYGKDTTDAASMALISHILSIITIPIIFMLVSNLLLK